MNRAHTRSEYVSQNSPYNSSNDLTTLKAVLTEIAHKKGSIKIEWAAELRVKYGHKWLSNCADKLDPKFLSLIKNQNFLS
ncbi:MAG: hypothetical protein ACJ0BL_00510 [Dehalococcoidia bacterium]